MNKKKELTDNNKVVLAILIFSFLFTTSIYSILGINLFDSVEYESDSTVVEVIDGDTIVLGNMEKIRLICIDSPEYGDDGYIESKKYLEELVLGKKVILEKDFSEKDMYDRLLRYVYVNDSEQGMIFVNKKMVETNNAMISKYPPDITLCDKIENDGL